MPVWRRPGMSPDGPVRLREILRTGDAGRALAGHAAACVVRAGLVVGTGSSVRCASQKHRCKPGILGGIWSTRPSHNFITCCTSRRSPVSSPSPVTQLPSKCHSGRLLTSNCDPRGSIATWQLEFPIAVRRGGNLISGSIDRLVLLRRGQNVVAADIIDFKTDSIEPSQEPDWSQRIAYYHSQLSMYADSVAQIFRIPAGRIAARLAFVEPGAVAACEVPA